MSSVFFVGWVGLKKTNDPLHRNNPFTLNRKWENRVNNGGMTAAESIFYDPYDKPNKDEEIQYNRDKKLKQIL